MNAGMDLFAEALVFVHGKGAESEAATHARLSEERGDHAAAAIWRQLQGAVRRLTRATDCANRKAA